MKRLLKTLVLVLALFAGTQARAGIPVIDVMGCLEPKGALTPEQQEAPRRLAAEAYLRTHAIALGRADGDAVAPRRTDMAASEEAKATVPGLLSVPDLLRLNACLDAADAQAQQQNQADAYNADKAAAVARARSTHLSPPAQGGASLAITPDPMVLVAPSNLPGATR